MTTPPTVALPHPLVDESAPGWAASVATSPLVGLNSGRSALLVDAARAGVQVLLVTPSTSRLTLPMYQVLHVLGGRWLTRDPAGGLRDAISGQALGGFEEAADVATVVDGILGRAAASGSEPLMPRADPSQLRPWLQFTVAVHHPARVETSIGGAAEQLIEALTGAPPVAWGTAEPATAPWDRGAVTALARVRMPEDSRILLSGGDRIRYAGSVRVARSEIGVIEETRLVFALPEGSVQDAARDAVALLARLADRQQVLLATAWSMRGAEDASVLPYWPTAPQPVAAVVGARGVRATGIDVTALERDHGASRAGNTRAPSLVLDFSADEVRWQRFAAVFDSVGSDAIAAALAPPGVRRAP